VIRCSSLFLKHVLAIVRSKADEKAMMDLPSAFTFPRPYPPRKPAKPLDTLLTCPLRSPPRKIFSPSGIS